MRQYRLTVLAALLCTGLLKAEEPQPWSPEPGLEWRSQEVTDLRVKEGSALDFSRWVEPGPAGRKGFVVVTPDGRLAFEKAPNEPVRFFTAGDCMGWWPVKTPDDIEEYAEQVLRAGYNGFRVHFLDDMLRIGTTKDGELEPSQLDRWDRLSAALKKRGIYLFFDISTSPNSFYALPRQGLKQDHNLKARLYWDSEARRHWKEGMRQLLEHVNPYTGVALKDEPQVVLFQVRNESGFHFLFNDGKALPVELLPEFHSWLKDHYGSVETLNQAWGTQWKTFEEVTFPGRKGVARDTSDLQRFLVDTELETYRWLSREVREIGVRVPVIDYNVGVEFAGHLAKSALPWIDTHAYHNHPTNWITPGSSQPNESAISSGLEFFAWLNEPRQIDRPFSVSEWGYPYWNQWRYEAGVSVPAYASFQDWQMLTQHSEPIRLKADLRLMPFKIAYDPPCRAAERMAAFFFARRDVEPARHLVGFQLTPKAIFDRWGAEAYLPLFLRKMPLLVGCGFQIRDFPDSLPGAKVTPDAWLVPDAEKAAFRWEQLPAKVQNLSPMVTGTLGLVRALREFGLLTPENPTDPSKGLYQSDTGELTLDMRAKTLRVDTPRSQAAALPEGSPAAVLSDVTFTNKEASGTFFVGSLDGKPIRSSRRLLLITVGDALNTGSVFSDASRKELRELGKLPILVRSLSVEIDLKQTAVSEEGGWWTRLKSYFHPQPEPRLWALDVTGKRFAELPVERMEGGLRLKIDFRRMETPAFYYELTWE